jgi:hypothetical protein
LKYPDSTQNAPTKANEKRTLVRTPANDSLSGIISVMNVLRTSVTAFSCALLLAFVSVAQSQMNFCELMRHPETYHGKTVKVRATWGYGYEWSYLHCLGCDARVWLDTSDLDEQSEKIIKHIPKGAAIVNIDVEGVFQADGSFGHLNGYKYQLRAHTISNPVVISTGMKEPEKELEIERKFACGGLKPR